MWCWGSNQGFVHVRPTQCHHSLHTVMYVYMMYVYMYISPYVLHTMMYIWCVYMYVYITMCITYCDVCVYVCIYHCMYYILWRMYIWKFLFPDIPNSVISITLLVLISQFLVPAICATLAMVAHTCNLSTGETEAEPLRKLGCVSEFCLSKRKIFCAERKACSAQSTCDYFENC